MFRTKIFGIVFALALVGLPSLALLKSTSWQLVMAQRLERHGRYETALQVYRAVLAHVSHPNDHVTSEIYYRIGVCLWNLGHASEAFVSFQKSVDSDGANVPARLRLGLIYVAGGAADRAADQAHAVLQLSPGNTEGFALLGAAAASAGDDETARHAYEHVIQADPGRVEVAVDLADILNRLDRVDDARRVLLRCAQVRPAKAEPWLALGRLEEEQGNTDAADEAYHTAVAKEDTPETNLRLAQFLERTAKLNDAQSVLRRVDSLRPSFPVALADFQIEAGNPADALDAYAVAVRTHRVLTNGNSQSRAEIIARLIEADLASAWRFELPSGSILRSKLNLQQYRRDLDPATLSILQAEIALAENDVAAALAHADSAVVLAGESPAARYVRGVARYRSGDRTSARTDWLDALDLDSSNVPVRLALSQDALETGDYAGSEHYVISVVRNEPANLRALDLFGRALLGQRHLASAAVIARRAVAIDPDSAGPHVLLADVLLEQRQYAMALLEYERAVVAQPRSERALDGLTRIYRRGVITRPMLRKMEIVAQSPPASAALMEIAGRLYSERGWNDDARRCFQHAVQIDPHRVTAAAALARSFLSDGKFNAAADSAEKMGGVAAAMIAGLGAEQRGDDNAAAVAYESAYRQGDTSGVAANNLAWIYAQQNRNLDRALLVANKAASLRPRDPAVFDTLGFVYLRRREYSDAITTLEHARAMLVAPAAGGVDSSTADSIRRHLAEGYLRTGQPEAAGRLQRDSRLLGLLAYPSRSSTRPQSFTQHRSQ